MPNAAMIVELKPRPSTEDEAEQLAGRLRQQSILTEFGWHALETKDLDHLFADAVQCCAKGVRADLCKLLEFVAARDSLLVRAGVGWRPGIVGHELLDIDLETPSGFAFRTGRPVISNHLENEQRFRTPPLLVEHGVKRAINVPIALSGDRLWGVLAADSQNEGQFDEADIEFMQGMAHAIGAAIEREEWRRRLEASADLIRHSDDPIIVWTIAEGVETWSDGAAELYGFTEKEALHRRPAELLGTRFPAPWTEIVGQLRSQGSWEGELIKRGKDGRETVLWSRLRLVVDADGTERVLEVSRDITSRKRMEDALRAAEARLRMVIEAIPALVFEADAEGRSTYVNAPFSVFTGLPREALLDERWINLLHPDDREESFAAWRQSVDTASPYEREFRLKSAAGDWRWFLARGNPIRDADGAVKKWIGVCSDIDAAKHAEAALREREEQFRTMADSLPQLAWMADAKGWIYWYNRRWYEYTGTDLEEMCGWGWRNVHHPDHVDRVVERISHSWNTGEPWEDSFPLRGADGEYRWFLSRAEPIRDADGNVIRWFGTNTDITERQKLEEMQRLLMSEISHRVKNSLTLVSSLLGLQARDLTDGPRAALEDASARVRAVAIVHDQLWRQADASAVNLAGFLSNLAGAVATTAPQHDTVVDVEPEVVPAEVAVPIGLFVNELVTNAYKYAYPEGEEGEVRITGAHCADQRYRLEVVDRGGGLPEGFDFDQSTSSLGMRVITSLARQLGGDLSAGSANPGARFTLEFPLKAVA